MHRAHRRASKRALATVAGLGLVGGMLSAGAATATGPADHAGSSVSASEFSDGSYIVLLQDAPLATNPGTAAAPGQKLDTTTSAATSYADQLAAAQDRVLAEVAADPTYRYDTVLNGFAVNLTAAEAAALTERGDVKSVTPAQRQELHTTDVERPAGSAIPNTDISPDFLGLTGDDGLWAQLGGQDVAGEGLVVGIIDTGLAYDNPSFTDGEVGSPPADWNGTCETGEDDTWPEDGCTDKVIGANFFVDGLRDEGAEPAPHELVSPADQNGHGSHVAGTAAGFPLTLEGEPPLEISGMAPAAHISVYKVCWDFVFEGEEGGTCMNTDSAAAIEKAVEDGVDVLNYSIGNPADDEYNNGPVAEAFRGAAAAGVFSANSAGNSGPEGNPPNMPVSNNAPWVMTVAAATHAEDDSPTIAGFSSRGPVNRDNEEQNLLKPDIGAPGVEVLAAVPDGFALLSGTSMASPHIAGLGILMQQGNPEFSPMAIKSAMQTTAGDYTDDESNDPFLGGVGFVAPQVFLNPGLVFDAGEADWDAFEADYTTGYNYNTASLQIGDLGADGPTETTRTVTNVTDAEVTYTAAFEGPAGLEVIVDPETVTVPAGETAEVTISVRNVDAPTDEWQKGVLTWSGEGNPDVAFPVIARGEQSDGEEPPPEVEIDRLAGEDRYATAAALAGEYEGVDTVYLASGQGYPDALAGSPAATQGFSPAEAGVMATPDGEPAPVLLTQQSNLPNVTADALTDLGVSNVIILGGTAIIDESVEDALGDYDVTRVAGEHRYDTAGELAKMFEPGADVVYVASGEDEAYPDALTGAALAGSQGATVLLTKTDNVPEATTEALEHLDADQVVVLGGAAAVSDEVYEELGATERLAGEDRWETALAVSGHYADDIPVLYVATGVNYPDALAASALAGSVDAPVLLAQQNNLPSALRPELQRLSPERVVIVGGTTVVSEGVEAQILALLSE